MNNKNEGDGSGWKEVKLRDLTTRITKGTTPSTYGFEYTKEGVNYIRAEGISKDGYVDEDTFYKINSECHKKLKRSQLLENDILFSIAGMALGKTGLVTKKYLPANTNQAVAIISYDKMKVVPKFLLYHFVNPHFYKIVNSVSGQAAQPNINLEQVGDLKILLPPLPTQKRIASILSAYDDLIENNLKRIKLLEELAQRTYEEWFVKFTINGEQLPIDEKTGLPVGWNLEKLGKVAEINNNSIKKGFQGTIKYVDIASVSTGSIDSWIEYKFNEAPGRAKRILKHGDIIWSCVRPNRKSYSLIWNPINNLIGSTGFAVITPKNIPSSYLYYSVSTDLFVGYLSNLASGAAYPAVTSKVFENYDILVPSKELILQFDKLIVPIFNQISTLNKEIVLLKESRDILLPKLMNGTLNIAN